MLKKRHGLAFTLISTFLMWGKDFCLPFSET